MSKSALTFTILTLVTIIVWAVYSVVAELNKTQISEQIQTNASTITNKSFDRSYLTDIYKRKSI